MSDEIKYYYEELTTNKKHVSEYPFLAELTWNGSSTGVDSHCFEGSTNNSVILFITDNKTGLSYSIDNNLGKLSGLTKTVMRFDEYGKTLSPVLDSILGKSSEGVLESGLKAGLEVGSSIINKANSDDVIDSYQRYNKSSLTTSIPKVIKYFFNNKDVTEEVTTFISTYSLIGTASVENTKVIWSHGIQYSLNANSMMSTITNGKDTIDKLKDFLNQLLGKYTGHYYSLRTMYHTYNDIFPTKVNINYSVDKRAASVSIDFSYISSYLALVDNYPQFVDKIYRPDIDKSIMDKYNRHTSKTASENTKK